MNSISIDELYSKTLVVPMCSCHLYIGSTFVSGYGRVKIGGQTYRAHRVSYELHKGPIPNGMFVCHHCDVPSCINPDHLFLGTPRDNMMDMIRKGRNGKLITEKGEDHHNAKLKNADIPVIRELHKSGMTQVAIGKIYGVSNKVIHKIVSGEKWKSIN